MLRKLEKSLSKLQIAIGQLSRRPEINAGVIGKVWGEKCCTNPSEPLGLRCSCGWVITGPDQFSRPESPPGCKVTWTNVHLVKKWGTLEDYNKHTPYKHMSCSLQFPDSCELVFQDIYDEWHHLCKVCCDCNKDGVCCRGCPVDGGGGPPGDDTGDI